MQRKALKERVDIIGKLEELEKKMDEIQRRIG